MDDERIGGWQVAFLIFAALLLAVPAADAMHAWFPAATDAGLGRSLPVIVAAIAILAVPAWRHATMAQLAVPVPEDRRGEVLLLAGAHIGTAFAWLGAYVLWWSMLEGVTALQQRIGEAPSHLRAFDAATSTWGVIAGVFVAAFVAPLVEELVFRGLLYRAWERRYGWGASLLMTSTVFGLCHPNFVPSFTASVLYVCAYRRTGTLVAPMIAHGTYNLLCWYPLLGQFVMPRDLLAPGDLASWKLQIAALLVTCVALPAYVWISREERAAAAPLEALGDAALSR